MSSHSEKHTPSSKDELNSSVESATVSFSDEDNQDESMSSEVSLIPPGQKLNYSSAENKSIDNIVIHEDANSSWEMLCKHDDCQIDEASQLSKHVRRESPANCSAACQNPFIPLKMSTPHRVSECLGAKLDGSDMSWTPSMATPTVAMGQNTSVDRLHLSESKNVHIHRSHSSSTPVVGLQNYTPVADGNCLHDNSELLNIFDDGEEWMNENNRATSPIITSSCRQRNLEEIEMKLSRNQRRFIKSQSASKLKPGISPALDGRLGFLFTSPKHRKKCLKKPRKLLLDDDIISAVIQKDQTTSSKRTVRCSTLRKEELPSECSEFNLNLNDSVSKECNKLQTLPPANSSEMLTQDFLPGVSPETLEAICQASEAVSEMENDFPLSPIISSTQCTFKFQLPPEREKCNESVEMLGRTCDKINIYNVVEESPDCCSDKSVLAESIHVRKFVYPKASQIIKGNPQSTLWLKDTQSDCVKPAIESKRTIPKDISTTVVNLGSVGFQEDFNSFSWFTQNNVKNIDTAQERLSTVNDISEQLAVDKEDIHNSFVYNGFLQDENVDTFPMTQTICAELSKNASRHYDQRHFTLCSQIVQNSSMCETEEEQSNFELEDVELSSQKDLDGECVVHSRSDLSSKRLRVVENLKPNCSDKKKIKYETRLTKLDSKLDMLSVTSCTVTELSKENTDFVCDDSFQKAEQTRPSGMENSKRPENFSESLQTVYFDAEKDKLIKQNSRTILNESDISALRRQSKITDEDALRQLEWKRLGNDEDLLPSNKNDQTSFGGFLTGNGKAIVISDQSLHEAKRIFEEIRIEEDCIDNICTKQVQVETNMRKPFCGFSSASGKLINVTTDALNKAKKLFSEEMTDTKIDAVVNLSSSSNSKRKLEICDAELRVDLAVDNAQKTTRNNNAELAAREIKPCSRNGFSDTPQESRKIKLMSKSICEESWDQSETKLMCVDKSKSKPQNRVSFGGFSTAGGKNIEVSLKALKAAKESFNDCDNVEGAIESDHQRMVDDLQNPFSVFATAGGKNIEISDDDLKKVKNLVNTDSEVHCNSFDFQMSPVLKSINNQSATRKNDKLHERKAGGGFATAGGKTIEVSEKALKAVKIFFDDCVAIDEDYNCQTETFIGQEDKPEISVDSEVKIKWNEICAEVEHIVAANSDKDITENQAKEMGIKESKLQSVPFRSDLKDTQNEDLRNMKNACMDLEIQESMAAFLADEDIENKPSISDDVLNVHPKRDEARKCQEDKIQLKSKEFIRPIPGHLFQQRTAHEGRRPSLKMSVEGRQPQSYSTTELLMLGVKRYVLSINSLNAEDFKFNTREHDNSYTDEVIQYEIEGFESVILDNKGFAGKEEISRALTASPGVEPKLITKDWIFNHYRWIIWKLAAMEVSFPEYFAGRCLTVELVMHQLKYRYDLEIDKGKRSALKRILEQDDSSTKTLVLCVSAIYEECQQKIDRVSGNGENNPNQTSSEKFVMEVTDGWYKIRVAANACLQNMIGAGKLFVGKKIITHSAEVVGSTDACSPLEAPANIRLKLHVNSTRPARWYTKLGFFRVPQPFPVPLSSLIADGGIVSCTNVIIARVYPVQYMERLEHGCIFRSAKSESKAAASHEETCAILQEKLMCKVMRKITSETEEKHRKKSKTLHEVSILETGEEINEVLETDMDPTNLQSVLTSSQVNLLADYRNKLIEKQQKQFEIEFVKALTEEREEGRFPENRNVVPFIRILLAGILPQDLKRKFTTILTFWRPTENLELLQEGSAFSLYYVNCSRCRIRQNMVQVSSARHTRFKTLRVDDEMTLAIYKKRQVYPLQVIKRRDFGAPYGEVDLVGIVVDISDSRIHGKGFQTVFIADESNDVIGIRFWGGIALSGAGDSIVISNFIAASNLQRRSSDAIAGIFYLDVTEFTIFSQVPRQLHLKEALKNLKLNVQSPNDIVEQATEAIRLASNRDSVINHKNSTCLHIGQGASGGDISPKQETTQIAQQGPDLAESSLNNGQKEKLSEGNKSRLKQLMYVGIPPPLSPLAIPISNKVRKGFKSPFRKL